MLEALVPAEGLRGRHQPRVWIARPGVRRHGIIALTARDVAVQEQTVVALMQGSLDADEFCAAVVWALAVRTSEGRGAGHAAVEVFCLPASAVSRLLRPAGQLATWPLIGTCWALRGGVALIGLVQSAATEHAWAGVGALLVVALSYAHPRWTRRRHAQLEQAGDDEVARAGLAGVWVRMLSRGPGTLSTQARIARLESPTATSGVRLARPTGHR